MKANEVIMIGRRRSCEASMAASPGVMPCSCCCLANSTISTAFLHASPASTTKPICVKRLLSMPRSHTPAKAQSRLIGTIRMMASGSGQLSYSAECVRNTKQNAQREDEQGRVAGRMFLERQLGPFVGHAWGQFACRPVFSIVCMAWPELMPGAQAPLIAAAV